MFLDLEQRVDGHEQALFANEVDAISDDASTSETGLSLEREGGGGKPCLEEGVGDDDERRRVA